MTLILQIASTESGVIIKKGSQSAPEGSFLSFDFMTLILHIAGKVSPFDFMTLILHIAGKVSPGSQLHSPRRDRRVAHSTSRQNPPNTCAKHVASSKLEIVRRR